MAAGDNRHWKAAERAQDIDQRPRRHSLYGYELHDLLAAGKHKGGGTLGVVMSYTEPICLYLQTALNRVRDCTDLADELSRGSELALTLLAAVNTLSGTYGMCNTLRTLVVERVQVTAPGCTAGDKRRQQWVESQLNEDDLGRTDVAPRIRKLRWMPPRSASGARSTVPPARRSPCHSSSSRADLVRLLTPRPPLPTP